MIDTPAELIVLTSVPPTYRLLNFTLTPVPATESLTMKRPVPPNTKVAPTPVMLWLVGAPIALKAASWSVVQPSVPPSPTTTLALPLIVTVLSK